MEKIKLINICGNYQRIRLKTARETNTSNSTRQQNEIKEIRLKKMQWNQSVHCSIFEKHQYGIWSLDLFKHTPSMGILFRLFACLQASLNKFSQFKRDQTPTPNKPNLSLYSPYQRQGNTAICVDV